eukprot:4402644-Pyramimonas_sp.AAC.3
MSVSSPSGSVLTVRCSSIDPPPDQSQPLNRNMPHRRTSHSPSIGIYPTDNCASSGPVVLRARHTHTL